MVFRRNWISGPSPMRKRGGGKKGCAVDGIKKKKGGCAVVAGEADGPDR